ncbi:MAG: hypothetical protein PHW54_02620 [Candidatus Omnitrophica bacterium]|nr:hypothetical protein [Candidatus Omnitrophota bacterium]
MKIICTRCKTVMGEQKPYKDSTEIKATCTACIEKAKEEAARFVPEPEPRDGQEITLENGLKGTLWVAKDKKGKLSFGEMVVSGKKFYCLSNGREKFQAYLGGLTGEEADVSLLHSITCKIDPPLRGRRKKQDPPKTEEPKKDESIHYNCTIRVPKHYIQLMFDDMAERMDKVAKILAEAVLKTYREESKTAQLSLDKP